MPRDPIAMTLPDISEFAKALRAELKDPPSHVELLGVIARSAGYRNYQHLHARLADKPVSVVDDRKITRAARYFDQEGRFMEWPAKTSVQRLCLWVIWAQLPARDILTERQISARIDTLCVFRDAAQIRRSLLEWKMVTRNLDGSAYERIETAPPPEAIALTRKILGQK